MASIGGRLAKVMYGSSLVAGIGTWSMSGFVPDIKEEAEEARDSRKLVHG